MVDEIVCVCLFFFIGILDASIILFTINHDKYNHNLIFPAQALIEFGIYITPTLSSQISCFFCPKKVHQIQIMNNILLKTAPIKKISHTGNATLYPSIQILRRFGEKKYKYILSFFFGKEKSKL